MKLYYDGASASELEEVLKLGIITGVTTNLSFCKKVMKENNENYFTVLSSIKKIIIAESRANENQIFPTRLIKGSIAARQLRAGRILSRIDFNERKRALFVTENIRYGGLVDSTNTEMRTTNDRIPKNSVLNLSALGRVQAVRLLRSDTLLRHSDVRPAPLVRSGEATTLSIKKGSLNIAVTLIALENGLMGELIKLKNPDSGENLVARVAGVGKVTLPN